MSATPPPPTSRERDYEREEGASNSASSSSSARQGADIGMPLPSIVVETHPPPPPPRESDIVNTARTQPLPPRDFDDPASSPHRPFSLRRRNVPPHPLRRSASADSIEKAPLDDEYDRRPTSPVRRETDASATTTTTRPTMWADPRRRLPTRRRPVDLGYIIPETGPKTVEQRIAPTLENAKQELAKYTRKALMTGYSLNLAIGLQVVISALITGLSAVTSGKNTSVMTSILGGIGTLVASYLARARGSGEPELSTARVKDLEKFKRECEAFVDDFGHELGHGQDGRINELRAQFEQLLGNGDSQRKLQPPIS